MTDRRPSLPSQSLQILFVSGPGADSDVFHYVLQMTHLHICRTFPYFVKTGLKKTEKLDIIKK